MVEIIWKCHILLIPLHSQKPNMVLPKPARQVGEITGEVAELVDALL